MKHAPPDLAAAAAERGELNFRRFLRFRGSSYPLELQALDVPGNRFDANRFAHARDEDEAVKLVLEAEKWSAPGVFVLFNAVDSAVATRAKAGAWHTQKGKGHGTTDSDVRRRLILFVDVDARRPTGTSSTAEELEAARVVGEAVYERIARALGTTAPLGWGMSGNGHTVMVALDAIPESPELVAKVKAILAALDTLHSDERVHVDLTVCDAKRLCPAFGTTKRKGAPGIAERPHRRTAFACAEQVLRVGMGGLDELLAALRAELPEKPAPARAAAPARAPRPAQPRAGGNEDLFRRCKDEAPILDVLEWLGLLDGEQPICPGCGESDGSTVAVVGNGLKCMHNRCSGRGLSGFYTALDVVMTRRDVPVVDAARMMAERFGFAAPPPRQKPAAPASKPHVAPPEELTPIEAYEEDEATPAATHDAATGTHVDPLWRQKLLWTVEKRPRVKKALDNIVTVLRHHPGWLDEAGDPILRHNSFANAIETTRPPPWHSERIPAGEWTDADDARLVCWLEREIDVSFSSPMVRQGVELVALRRSYHPVVEWLASLRWDGTVRLGKEGGWLARYCGCKVDAERQPASYLEQVGRWWLISAVARVHRPGCQVDHLLMLEGMQGAGKSSLVRALGDPWTLETTIALGDKDSYQVLRGRWLVELAELAAMRRSEVERIKAYVSSAVDIYRPSYARSPARFPRQCVFVGTTNADQYLADATGNRRFWPVRCGTLDREGLQRDRELLWAEARTRFEDGERWWPERTEAADLTEQQLARLEQDAWQDKVESYLVSPLHEVTVGDILGGPLGIEPARWDQGVQNRVARCLQIAGWLRVQRREGKRRYWTYVRGAEASPSRVTSSASGDTGDTTREGRPLVTSVTSSVTT